MSDEDKKEEAPAEGEDFESAFNEIAENKDGGDANEDLDADLGDELDDKSDEKKDDESDNLDDDKAKSDDKEEVDIYAGMSEDVKAHFLGIEEENKNLNHRLDSDAGRVSAFQLKINSMEKEIQNIRQGSTAGDQPSKTEISDAMSGSDEGWEQFSKDYPEVAEAIDSRLSQAGKATQESVENTLAPVIEKQAKNTETEALAAATAARAPVTELFPEWEEEVQKPEFSLWLDEQSPGVQALSASDDSKDASLLIGLYDEHLVANDKPSLKAEVKDKEIVPGPGDEPEEKKTTLAARRAQQLEDGATIKSKNSRIDPSKEPADDFDAAFNFHAKQKDRKRATG